MTTSAPAITLTDLPLSVLMHIVHKAGWEACQGLGTVSNRMCAAVDAHVLSQFKKTIHKVLSRDSKHPEANVLLVIELVAEPYVEWGFSSTLVASLLENCTDPFKRKIKDFVPFLLKFFGKIKDTTTQGTQQSRLLLNVAMMRILGSFKNQEVLASFSTTHQWRHAFEVRGPWLGFLSATRYLAPERHCYLVAVLGKLLYFNLMQDIYTSLREGESSIFIYGHTLSHSLARMPVTRFSIEVNGPQEICQFLRSTYADVMHDMEWPETLPTQDFNVTMEIYSPKAARQGCAAGMIVASAPMEQSAIWSYRRETYLTKN